VIGHLLRDFELAAVAQVFGNTGSAERMAADLLVRIPASAARRWIIRYASAWLVDRSEIDRCDRAGVAKGCGEKKERKTVKIGYARVSTEDQNLDL
jgi:predicted site-specific integrase-resolvase